MATGADTLAALGTRIWVEEETGKLIEKWPKDVMANFYLKQEEKARLGSDCCQTT